MKQITLFILLFWGSNLFSQNNTTSSGGDINGSNGSVSYTIGQIDYISTINANGSIYQGNQQPYEFYNTIGLNEDNLMVSIYPNPTTNDIQIQISNFSGLEYQLVDENGKLIFQDKLSSETSIVNMSELAAAKYFLQIKKDEEILENMIIIKN